MGFDCCFDPTLVFFFEIKKISFSKKLQVLNLPLVIFFRKSLGHSQIQKKIKAKMTKSPHFSMLKFLDGHAFSHNFFAISIHLSF